MAANRYTNAHKNLGTTEVDWDVEIYDDAGTPVGTFSISGSDGCVFREEGPSQDHLPGIYPTSVDINFTVEDSQGEFMMTDIRDKDRSRFAVKVYRDSVLFFVGRFAAHNIVLENSPMPYAVRLTAHDGLASLKNINYSVNDTTGYSGQDTFLEHISKCFSGLDIQTFYAGDFIDFTVNWYHSDMVDTTGNPLENSRVDHVAFQKDNGDFMSSWDVLKKICTGWGARLYYSAGFHFEQLSEREDTSFQRFVYDTSFVETGSSGTTSIEKTIDTSTASQSSGTAPTAGGTFGMLDKLKSVDVLLTLDKGNLAETLEWSYLDETSKDLGTIKLDKADDHIQLQGVIEYATTSSLTLLTGYLQHRYEVKITFILVNNDTTNTFYFTRTVTYPSFYNAVYTGMTTTQTPAPTMSLTGGVYTAAYGGSVKSIPWVIDTVLLSLMGSIGDSFTISMQVELVQIYAQNGTDIQTETVDYTFKWWMRSNVVEVLSGSSASSKTIKVHHIATNDLEAERKLEIDTCFGDLANKKNGVQVYDGTDWNFSDKTWGVGTVAGTKAIAQLLANELLKVRRVSKQLYHGGIISHEYQRDARYDFMSITWIPMSGSFASASDLFNGTLVEIAPDDDSTFTETETEVMEEVPPGLVQNPTDDPPIAPIPNPPQGLITDEPLDDVSAYTSVDVVNQNSITLDAGEWVIITNLLTAETDTVQLTADLGASDTSISIASYTFSDVYESGSPIGIAQVENFEWQMEKFTADATDVSNGYVTVTGPLSDPSTFTSDNNYFRWCLVTRGSSELDFSSSATSAMVDDEFGVVKVSERITFPDSWPLSVGEKIRVRYKIPRP